MRVNTTPAISWIYEAPADTGAKMFLLTVGKVAIVGKWGSGEGLIAYCPMPKRDKKLESEIFKQGNYDA